MSSSGISPSFLGLSRSSGWVTHVLLTRSRLCPGASPGSSLHLHVLSTPPAFVLSQDQTLREELLLTNELIVYRATRGAASTQRRARALRRGTAVLLDFWPGASARPRTRRAPGSNLDAHSNGRYGR